MLQLSRRHNLILPAVCCTECQYGNFTYLYQSWLQSIFEQTYFSFLDERLPEDICLIFNAKYSLPRSLQTLVIAFFSYLWSKIQYFQINLRPNFVHTGCKYTFQRSYGVITYGNVSGSLVNNGSCTFEISAIQGNQVTLTFLQFYLLESDGCNETSLKIYDRQLSDNNLKATMCGNDTSGYTSETGKVYLVLTTDGLDASEGFAVRYTGLLVIATILWKKRRYTFMEWTS